MADTSLRIPDGGWLGPLLVPTPFRHGSPNVAMLLAGMDPAATRAYQALLDCWDRRYIDTAIGAALDEFGRRIRAPRTSSEIGEDDAYRTRIKALMRYGLVSTAKQDIKTFLEAAYGLPVTVDDGGFYPPTLVITFLGWTKFLADSPAMIGQHVKPAGVVLSVRVLLPDDTIPNLVNEFSVDDTAISGDANLIVLV